MISDRQMTLEQEKSTSQTQKEVPQSVIDKSSLEYDNLNDCVAALIKKTK